MRDLEPFVCLFAHCSALSNFDTSEDWINHMRNAHSTYSWVCRAPSHDPIIFEQEVEYQHHVREAHAVPQAHVANLSSTALRLTLEPVRECPFGDELLAVGSDESNTIFAHQTMHLHVADHMKEIALLALHKLPHAD
jgi:hypothetical protein